MKSILSRIRHAIVIAAALIFVGTATAPGASIYVDLNAPGPGAVNDPNNPFATLRAGVAAITGDNDSIYVAAGVYDNAVEGFSSNGEIALSNTVYIYGGYAGYDSVSGTYDWGTRDPRSSVVDLAGAGTRAFNLSGVNYKRPLVDGFTFQNADHAGDGGAVRLSGGFQTGGFVNDCLFQNNTTTGNGGGLYMSLSYAGNGTVVTNSEFVNNTAAYGGALDIRASNGLSTITGNSFTDNTGTEGGAVHVSGGMTVLESAFYGNHASSHSGAIGNEGGSGGTTLVVGRSIFIGNSTDGNGAVTGLDHGFHAKNVTFENSLMANNTGNYALYHFGSGSLAVNFSTLADNENGILANTALSLTNSIVANNGAVGVFSNAASPVIEYSNVWGHVSDYAGTTAGPGTGALSVDPIFVSPAGNLYHLMLNSPLIAAADPAASLFIDVEGALRPQNGGFAMGAYETGVPEPTSLSLLAFGILALVRRHRRG